MATSKTRRRPSCGRHLQTSLARWLPLLVLWTTGCETVTTTQITVVVRSDLVPVADLTHLRVQTMLPSGEATGEDQIIEIGGMTEAEFPLSFGIVPAEDRADDRVRVVVTGLRAEGSGSGQTLEPRVRAQAITTFRDHYNGLLTMFLARNCWDVLCIPGGPAGDAIADLACDPGVGTCEEIPVDDGPEAFSRSETGRDVEVPGGQVLFQPCEAREVIASAGSSRQVATGIVNGLDEPIFLAWIDYDGQSVELTPQTISEILVEPGEAAGGYSFPEHPQMVGDADGNCLFIYVPLLDDSNFEVTPEIVASITPQGSVTVDVQGATSSLELLVNGGRSNPVILNGDGSYDLPGVYVLDVQTPPSGQTCTVTPSPPFDRLWFTRPRQTPMQSALIECQ